MKLSRGDRRLIAAVLMKEEREARLAKRNPRFALRTQARSAMNEAEMARLRWLVYS